MATSSDWPPERNTRQPPANQWAKRVETATKTYNFCISPLSPFAVKGFVWIPGEDNISTDVSRYAPALKVFLETLPETFGQDKAKILYVQPSDTLVKGINSPEVEGAVKIDISEWPSSLREIAEKLGEQAIITAPRSIV